jgi:hypothetical protein
LKIHSDDGRIPAQWRLRRWLGYPSARRSRQSRCCCRHGPATPATDPSPLLAHALYPDPKQIDGTISVHELLDVIQSELDTKKERDFLKKIAIVMGVFLLLTVAVTVGLTAAVVVLSKDTAVDNSGHMLVKGTTQAVKTSSGDFDLGQGGALQDPKSTVYDPSLIGETLADAAHLL